MNYFKSHKYKFIMLILLSLIILTAAEIYRSSNVLSVSHYQISTDKLSKPVRILQLSDLHNKVFGKDNQKLINLTKEQSPDLIFMTGDLLNSDETGTDTVTDLISELSKLTSVYISLGNHETAYQEKYDVDIKEIYEAAGAVLLDKQYEDILVNGQKIRLGGIYGYCLPAKYLQTNEANQEECDFLTDFQNTDTYTILMCHMPVCWVYNNGLSEWNVDCVFSGHAHGGQIVVPFLGGLYAPDMGGFPGRLEGLYYSQDAEKMMILSRGMGTSMVLPRINNTPEVVVTDLLPQ